MWWRSLTDFQQWVGKWIVWLKSEDDSLEIRVAKLEKGLKNMADLVAELKTEFESYKADVDAKVTELGQKIADLDAKIAAMPPAVDTTALQGVLDEVKAAHAALVAPAPSSEAGNDEPGEI